MNSYIVFLIFLQSVIFAQVSAQYTQNINAVMIGMVSPLWGSNYCVNGMQSFTDVKYSTHFTNILTYGISLIGYESVVQDQVYIKSSITKLNTTHVEISCSCEQLTLFTKMRFSYIIIQNEPGFSSIFRIYSECFLCNPQNSTTGYRRWNFNTTQHTTVYSNDIQISSSMFGFNVSNVEGDALNFNMSTTMKTTDNFIYHTIEAWNWTVVSSICITTIIYDFSKTGSIWKPWGIIALAQQKNITWSTKASNIQPRHSCFQNIITMFYGISAINILFQPKNSQIMFFDLIVPSNLNANFQGNQNIVNIQLSAFYVTSLDCPPGNSFDPSPMNYNCVSTCPVGMGANLTTKLCVACHPKCVTCQGSASNQCLTCNSSTINNFRQVLSAPNQCVCLSGYIEPTDGSIVCLSCSKLIPNCSICTNSTFCSTCQSNYTFNPVTNMCGCANTSQYLTQGYCLPFAGCLTIQFSTNIPAYCTSCDSSKNFQMVSENSTCRCKKNYTLSQSLIRCVDLCGDGIILTLDCDDGNLVNGDGCSSNCTIQPGYFCVDKLIQQPSLCMIMWNFTVSYLYCSRDITSNIGTFVFILKPIQPKISQMNLVSCLDFSFNSDIVSYLYDQRTGQLTVNAQFTQSIQGQNEIFTLNMGSVKIKTDQVRSGFGVSGMNSWLIYDSYSGVYKYVIYGIVAICFMAWILAIVISILGYRHLAIELIFPIQSIYLVLIQEHSNAPGLRALDLMKFIMGYNSFNGFKLKQISSVDDTQYFSLQYLQNLNLFILINILLLLIIMIPKAFHYKKSKLINQQQIQCDSMIVQQKNELKRCKNNNQINETNEKYEKMIKPYTTSIVQLTQKRKPVEKVLKYLVYRFCNIIALFIIQPSIYYMGTYMIHPALQQKFPYLLNNLSCMISMGLGLAALCIFPGKIDNDIRVVVYKKRKYSYTKGYMIWYVMFDGLMVFFGSFGVAAVALIPIVWISLIIIYLIVRNPYYDEDSRRSRFILPIIQQVILTVPMYLLWVAGFLQTFNPLIYFISTALIVVFCLIGIIITSIRLYFEYKHFKLLQQKTKLQAIQQNDLDEKEKNTSQIKDEEVGNSGNQNDKEFGTIPKAGNKGDGEDFKVKNNSIDDVKTNKRKNSQGERKNRDDSGSSDDQINQDNLQFIKRRLRTQLKTKRGAKPKPKS